MKKLNYVLAILSIIFLTEPVTFQAIGAEIDPGGKKFMVFKGEKKWLQIPIKNGATKRNVALLVNGKKVRWFNVELADDQADWFAYLNISDWKGKSIELVVDSLSSTSKAFSPIVQTDE